MNIYFTLLNSLGFCVTKYLQLCEFCLKVNPYNEPLWRAAVNRFHQSLQPTEERVASKLKSQLRSVNANTLQVSYQVSIYLSLFCIIN